MKNVVSNSTAGGPNRAARLLLATTQERGVNGRRIPLHVRQIRLQINLFGLSGKDAAHYVPVTLALALGLAQQSERLEVNTDSL